MDIGEGVPQRPRLDMHNSIYSCHDPISLGVDSDSKIYFILSIPVKLLHPRKRNLPWLICLCQFKPVSRRLAREWGVLSSQAAPPFQYLHTPLCHCLSFVVVKNVPKGPHELQGSPCVTMVGSLHPPPRLHPHCLLEGLFGDTLNILVISEHINHLSALHPNISILVILSDHHC